jgi:hypothetical protein
LSPGHPRTVLAREATRLHRRYLEEVVEQFSICPWAKSARMEGRVRTHVVVDTPFVVAGQSAIIDAWAEDPSAEVAFLIAPLFDGGAEAFAEIAERVGALRGDVFLTAPFHPNARPSAGTIHFLRQTPDPTIQLVRRTRLDAVRAQDPPHYADIFDLDLEQLESGVPAKTVAARVLAKNETLIAREGRSALQAILEDIREDRARSYG